jgi:glycosyltransferase involved in cell wall biosynthesis
MFEITIPVLNEEETLEENVLKSLHFVKSEITENFRIIIADNGSTDNTQQIGEQLARNNPEILFVKVPRRGVGLALRTSWMASEATVVGYMDLDLATDLSHLKEVYQLLFLEKSCDIVNGSRLLSKSKVKNRSLLREITSRGFNLIVKNYLGVGITDGMCGFKYFNREVAQNLIETGIDLDGWFFSTEILVKGDWSGKKITEIPVKWTDDPNSKVNVKNLSKQYFKEILRLKKEKKGYFNKNI